LFSGVLCGSFRALKDSGMVNGLRPGYFLLNCSSSCAHVGAQKLHSQYPLLGQKPIDHFTGPIVSHLFIFNTEFFILSLRFDIINIIKY
jgi:hypothetical protein